MKRNLSVLILTLLFFSIPLTVSANGYTNVTVSEANTMIDSNPSLIVLDVRTQSEYDSGHIRNAKLIPVSELETRLDELDTTDEILVHCKSGGRSAIASQILVDNGFLYVYNMLGGIIAWINGGFPVYVKYFSIQEAINNANDGDKILVSSGTYYENVLTNKTISLTGENSTSTVINGTLDVQANNVEITRFCIENGYGVRLENVTQCKIIETVTGNSSGFGIILYNASNSQIFCNEIYSNYYDGICLDQASNNNVISSNYIQDFSRHGIGIHQSAFNTIEENEIFSGGTGLHIRYASNNTVRTNTVIGCYTGLWMEHSHNNTLHHNSFLNNTIDASLPDSEGNIWDNGCEGNYWSDYNGADLNGDGVGDTELPWLGVDNYPLMNPYWNSADVNHDLKVDIYDVVLVCAAYGSTRLDSNWNPHCDIAEPYGIINIYDVVTVCTNYGKEYNP